MIIDAVGGDFVTTPELTVSKFTEEGNTWPVPEMQRSGVHGGQQGPTGEKTPFDVRGLNLDAATVDTIRAAAFSLTRKDIQFTSKDGKTKVVLEKVLLTVETHALNEFGQYGFVRFVGEGVAAGAAASSTVTHTP